MTKYDLFGAAYTAEMTNDQEVFLELIDLICANGWRNEYDKWCQCVKD